MILAVFASLLISMFIILVFIVIGNNVFERVMAVNSFANYIIVLMVILSLFKGNDSFVDIAFIYVLTNFIAASAFLRFFKSKGFSK